MRKVLFWIHLVAGVVAGLVILVMSVTGVLLAYERQILAWADGGYRSEVQKGAQALPLSALVSGVSPSAITIRADPAAPAEISVGRDKTFFVDRYTGAKVGEPSKPAHEFFRLVMGWHRWLGAGDANRASARAVTGACNLAFFFLVLTGLILWCPRRWSWQHVRPGIWFRRGLQGRAFEWNWHNTIGFWTAIPLAVIIFSAIFMSFRWASDLLVKNPRGGPEAAAGTPGPVSLDAVWEQASKQIPEWKTITIRIPNNLKAPVSASIDKGDGGRPDLRGQLILDRKTGDAIRWEPFSSYSAGRRARTWMRFLHTGEAGGVAGETIAAIASGGAAFLVWTGIAMAVRRFLRWRRRRVEKSSEEELIAPSVL